MRLKICITCRQEKELEEYHGDRSRKDGKSNRCRACKTIEKKRDWAVNKSRNVARRKQWVAANGERVRAYKRLWEAKNHDRVRAKQRAWYAANRGRVSLWTRARAIKNPDHARAKRVNAKAKRRSRGEIRKITAAEMRALIIRDEFCYLCRRRNTKTTYSVDHVTPLAKGGRHEFYNLKLVHLTCNLKKRDRIVMLPLEVAS
jgi:5-methylcytosine-specific restriction endonuclease McrA